ncbi:two-component regulator propeller domain-containing protein [Flagellimonas flava]|nr:hybrid sensor histidine kinase/response regulator transcription factor [Allomuricauda flava]
MAQDSLGFLWLATQDGLNRYDGQSIKQYPFQFTDITRPSFSRLGKVYVDRDGDVFIIPSDHKIYKYDRIKDNFLRVGKITDATTIWQDNSKNYWIGTSAGEFFLLNSDFTVLPFRANTRLKGQVKKINLASGDSPYILSEKSLVMIDKSTKAITEMPLETLLGEKMSSNLNTATLDEKGILWIGYYGDGLFYYDESNKSIRRLRNASFDGYLPQDLMILDLFFDNHGRLWITTYGDGLYLVDFSTNEINHFSEQKQNPRALHYNDILCAYQDDSGTLWFGTDGAGASFYDADLEKFNSFTNYQTPININIDVVRAITLDEINNVWVGTSGKGLTKYEPNTNSWITYTKVNSDISSNRIMSLYYDTDGELWVGTQNGGLNIMDRNSAFRTYRVSNSTSETSATIWDIFEDTHKNTWLGTRDNGLIHFDKKQGVLKQYLEFKVADSIVIRKNIRVLGQAPNGDIWMGTDKKGLVRFNSKTKKASIITTENSALSTNAIKSLFQDQNNVLWIGTYGKGLDAYDIVNEKFYNFSIEDGLPNKVIYSILPDEAGNLWLSSNRGITKFSLPNGLKNPPEITNYDNYDGLATEFNTGAYYKNKDGQLYFGGLEGFYWFDPQSIVENEYLPKTVITDFKILDVPKSIYSDTLLKHNENTIDFTFSSLQFSEPEKNQYKYRLLPYEEDWVVTGNKSFVRYTQLPPNEYEFQVVSSNYDGKWNSNPEKFNFTIAAPWYFNSWSKSVYALLLILTAVLVYRYLKWRWKIKLDLQLKQEEATRFKELNEYKSRIYTEIAHEFRTPLTLISGPIESKLSEPDISEEEANKFKMIERNASRLTNLVDQLLQLAKLEEGRIKLKKEWGNLGLFLKVIAASFDFEAQQKKLDYQYQVQDIPVASYDEDALGKIVVNLISNALKYGKQDGSCEFLASYDGGVLSIQMSNALENKIENVQTLFERFYQRDKNSKGAGIGLALVQKLVNLHKGEIDVTQSSGAIHFKVTLPLEIQQDSPKLENPKHQPNTGDEEPILLVVEDNPDVLDFIASEFEKSYKIIKANHGEIGIKMAFDLVPDIIITDVKMPFKDGIELCNTLKNDERTSHIPIILLTASNDKRNELNGLKAGADDYVTKPFKIKILEKRAANLVRSRKMLRERYSQENYLKPKDIAITPTDEIFLTKLEEVMNAHLENPDFNTEKFSTSMGMSRMQLHRKLTIYTGLSTSAFIRSQRLKQALQILKTSDASINEVAYAVGFNTPSYFIKCFKEAYKKTPAEFLQNQ